MKLSMPPAGYESYEVDLRYNSLGASTVYAPAGYTIDQIIVWPLTVSTNSISLRLYAKHEDVAYKTVTVLSHGIAGAHQAWPVTIPCNCEKVSSVINVGNDWCIAYCHGYREPNAGGGS